MTKEILAALLNGREYGNEITDAEAEDAKKHGLVVVFGYSDDNVEFRGAILEELGCGEDTEILVHQDGIFDGNHECDCDYCGFKDQSEQCASIMTKWGQEDYSWSYETIIPHARFDIVEGDEKYCRGIVFDLKDVPKLNSTR